MSPRRWRTGLGSGALLALALCLVAPPARAGAPIRLVIGDIYPDSSSVRVDFTIENPLPEPDSTAAAQAELPPAALACTVETWRDRSGWFDVFVSTRTFGYRIERDRIRELYRVTTPDGTIVEASDRAELSDLLSRQTGVVAAHLVDLTPEQRHYFTITVRLMPIDLNRLTDVEDWMNGEIRTGRRSDVLALPKAALGWLAELTGLGNREVSARSRPFRRPAGNDGATGPE